MCVVMWRNRSVKNFREFTMLEFTTGLVYVNDKLHEDCLKYLRPHVKSILIINNSGNKLNLGDSQTAVAEFPNKIEDFQALKTGIEIIMYGWILAVPQNTTVNPEYSVAVSNYMKKKTGIIYSDSTTIKSKPFSLQINYRKSFDLNYKNSIGDCYMINRDIYRNIDSPTNFDEFITRMGEISNFHHIADPLYNIHV